MAKSQIIAEWREVYSTGFTDGPNNPLKSRASRPAHWSMVLLLNHALAVRLPSGKEEVRRTTAAHECRGGTEEELAQAIESFLAPGDIRLLADRVRSNENDVPKQEPLSPALLDGSSLIYQPKP